MRLIGYRHSSFKAKDSDRMISGYTLYFTYPLSRGECEGVACDNCFVSDQRAEMSRFVPVIGSEIQVLYNKAGKVQSVQQVDYE